MSGEQSRQGRDCDRRPPAMALDAETALKHFRGLSRRRQSALIAELVMTRSDELLRAYPGLVAIGQGFRRRRVTGGDAVGEIVTNDRCVLFLVRKKWKAIGSARRRLPSHLFCHDLVRGKRTLLAIPTDVSEARPAQANAGLGAVDIAGHSDQGVLTCLIDCERSDRSIERRALSCRHVLSLTGTLSPEPSSARVTRDGALIGEALPIRGPLSNTGDSFDAQAVKLATPTAADRSVWATHWPQGFVAHAGELEPSMWLHLPRTGGPVRVHYRGVWSGLQVSYGSGANNFIATVGPLVELELAGNQRTRPGDSGSPLVIGYAQPRLAGMHIAGTPDDGHGRALSYCIPAYALLDPGNYAETAGETWQLS